MKIAPSLPFLSLALSALVAVSASAADRLTIAADGKERAYTLAELQRALKAITIEIDDPVYGGKKSFDGFPLREVLALGGLRPDAAADRADEIVFTAKDGYSPNTSFENVRAHDAVLAYREHGSKGAPFGLVAQGKAKISPAPFYLVWTEGKAMEHAAPWPYQLVRIEAVKFSEKYAKLYPADAKPDSSVMKGFRVFKNECLRCHSINLQGGDIGPELNAPRNVTEYWDEKTLKSFIRDAASFRYKSKMPGFPQLAAADIDAVVDYFRAMKAKKIEAPKP